MKNIILYILIVFGLTIPIYAGGVKQVDPNNVIMLTSNFSVQTYTNIAGQSVFSEVMPQSLRDYINLYGLTYTLIYPNAINARLSANCRVALKVPIAMIPVVRAFLQTNAIDSGLVTQTAYVVVIQ